MKVNQKFMSIFVVLMVVGLLVATGPARAITIGISDVKDADTGNAISEIAGTNAISFTAKVDLHTSDVIPEDMEFTVTVIDSQDATVSECSFEIDGTPLTACSDMNISLVSSYQNQVESLGLAYGYGYNYNISQYEETDINFSFGYGYTNGAGYGYDTYNTALSSTAEFMYNVVWTTPNVNADTDYEIEMTAYLDPSSPAFTDDEFEFETLAQNIKSITVVPITQAQTDENTVDAVMAGIEYGDLLHDYSTGAKDRVIGDLYLINNTNGVTISWNSTNPSVIANNGSIARQGVNTTVSLNATFEKGIISKTKLYTFIVKKTVTVTDEAAVDAVNGTVAITETEVVFDDAAAANKIKQITVNESVSESEPVQLNFGALVQNETLTVSSTNNLTLKRTTATVTYEAVVPNGTVISGGAGWNGVITLPTVETQTKTVSSGAVNVAINVGSGARLNFTKAVKITLGGMAGKSAAWSTGDDSALTKITQVCNSATAPSNVPTGGECAIDSGSDLVIWTYHFTTFAAYTPDPVVEDDDSSSPSNDDSSIVTTSSLPTKAIIYSEIVGGSTRTFVVGSSSIPVSKIKLTPNKDLMDVGIRVQSADLPSTYIAKLNTETFKIEGIDLNLEDMESIVLEFSSDLANPGIYSYETGEWIKATESGDVYTVQVETLGWFGLGIYDGIETTPVETINNTEPIACTMDYTPVCGVDDVTYSNMCMLNASNVELAYEGECEVVDTTIPTDDTIVDEPEPKKGIPTGVWVGLIIVLGFLVVVGAVFYKLRKRY